MRMPRIPAIAALFASVGALACLGCGDDPLARPDLVLVTVAPFDVEATECHGGPEGAAAELCAVGEAGTRYVWAFASASHSP